MSVTAHDISFETLDALEGYDSLCLFVAEDERPLKGAAGWVDWRLCGALSRVLMDGFFVGAEADSLLLPTSGKFPMPRVFVIGLGQSKRLNPDALGRVLAKATEVLKRANAEAIAIELPGEGVLDDGTRAGALKAQLLPGFQKAKVAVLGGRQLGRLVGAE